MSKIEIPLGEKFGRLTVIEDLGICILPNSNTKCRNVKCRCDCGNVISAQWSNVKYGNKKSCGCLQSEKSKETVKIMNEKKTKHGDAKGKKTRLYNTWCRMRARCNNPNNDKYKWYGGQGIKVCKEWDDYANFKKWALENGYTDELTIDRIDVTGNYEPSNCQWLTMQDNIDKEYTIDRDRRRDA